MCEEKLQGFEQVIQEIHKGTQDLVVLMHTHLELDRIFIGDVVVNGDGDDVGIWLNGNSKIVEYYKEGERFCITTINGDRRRCDFVVLGIVDITAPGVLGELPRKAGAVLRIGAAQMHVVYGVECANVKIEPFVYTDGGD